MLREQKDLLQNSKNFVCAGAGRDTAAWPGTKLQGPLALYPAFQDRTKVVVVILGCKGPLSTLGK